MYIYICICMCHIHNSIYIWIIYFTSGSANSWSVSSQQLSLTGSSVFSIGLTSRAHTLLFTHKYIFYVKGALQLLSKRHMSNRFAQVPERISVSSSDGDHQRFILDLPMKSGTTRKKWLKSRNWNRRYYESQHQSH